jgi:hypothetical protein
VLARDLPPPPPPPPPPASPAPLDGPPTDAPAGPVFPWKVALIAFVVLGAAYVSAYLLLTAEGRRQRSALERQYGAAIEAFEPPGDEPSAADTAAYRAFTQRRQLHAERLRYEELGRRMDVMFLAMIGAFAVQTVLTGGLLLRTLRASRAAPVRPTRPRAR